MAWHCIAAAEGAQYFASGEYGFDPRVAGRSMMFAVRHFVAPADAAFACAHGFALHCCGIFFGGGEVNHWRVDVDPKNTRFQAETCMLLYAPPASVNGAHPNLCLGSWFLDGLPFLWRGRPFYGRACLPFWGSGLGESKCEWW